MDCKQILRQLNVTRKELELLCELADHADLSAYGRFGLGADAPVVRARLMKKGFISQPYPRAERRRNAVWLRMYKGGRITVKGCKVVRRARYLGWCGRGGGDARLQDLERQHRAILAECRALALPDNQDDVYAAMLSGIETAITAVPADSWAGVCVKIRLWVWKDDHGVDDRSLCNSFLDDIVPWRESRKLVVNNNEGDDHA